MSLKRTLILCFAVLSTIFYSNLLEAQPCTLTASATTTESLCKATGTISVNANNGTGNYNYIITGPGYNSTTSSNLIAGLQAGVYTVKVKDIVTGCIVQLDSVIVPGTYQDPRFLLNETDITCAGANDGTITVTNVQFGKAPFSFSIVAPSASGVGTTNATGLFTNLSPGNYTIQLSDSCGGLQTRIITLSNHTWSITATSVSKIGCDSANITLTITDNSGNTNASGSNFTGYLYGWVRGVGDTVWSASRTFGINLGTSHAATFVVKDPCGNVAVTNWVDNKKPNVNATVSLSNKVCNTFTASVTGQQNLTSPQFCLYDNAHVLITCNTTGVFNLLPYGSYCIDITDNCYDTTFTRCFTAFPNLPGISGVNISNKTCTDFSVTVHTTNTTNGQYCLYDIYGVPVICNSTGVFNNIPFGTYCAKVQNDPACYDTLLINCFTVTQPVPSVNNSVSITRGCGTFTAKISGQNNLTNPQYCLYDSANNQLSCNTTGQFTNLAYGSYCIHVINDSTCYDTTIIRCFTVNQIPVSISVNANPSCTIGGTDVRINLSNGTAPYTVNVYDPGGVLVNTTNTSSTTINITGLPGLAAGLKYKVVVAGGCGSLDSTSFTPHSSSVTTTINANSKCPGGIWANGSGDLLVYAVFSEGNITPKIIKKDGVGVSINYTSRSGANYTFSNLGPAVYIIQYDLENCSNFVYDTFNLAQYQFPAMSQNSVYQCNNNSFNLNTSATGGLTPYTYEIIGSTPSSPSIVQGPQASPLFNINNGTTYSVVRLRVIDFCGNATINDVSILPLGNTIVTASSNCFYNNITLSVDTIPNATYSWYRKTSPVDSVLVGSSQTYNIPNLLPSDTGVYVSVVSVNSGCLTKVSSFDITGACGMGLLANNGIAFGGKPDKDNIQLNWTTDKGFEAVSFIVERSEDGIHFTAIGTVNASANSNQSASQYYFSDVNAPVGKNYYRLVILKPNSVSAFTKIIEFTKLAGIRVTVTPNPVPDAFTIHFQQGTPANYNVSLVSDDGKIILKSNYSIQPGEARIIQRPAATASGVYYLLIRNVSTSESDIIKLVFK